MRNELYKGVNKMLTRVKVKPRSDLEVSIRENFIYTQTLQFQKIDFKFAQEKFKSGKKSHHISTSSFEKYDVLSTSLVWRIPGLPRSGASPALSSANQPSNLSPSRQV